MNDNTDYVPVLSVDCTADPDSESMYKSIEEHKEMNDPITELIVKIADSQHTLWEEKMMLCINEKPWYIPDQLWNKLLRLILVQRIEKK